mmetsp:Transcript_80085/g.120335  ORF Transcript_80085/g.120335 Transcript_80085/m.120335 type:complete len:87 (-) Transcript_80085:163-423(-)
MISITILPVSDKKVLNGQRGKRKLIALCVLLILLHKKWNGWEILQNWKENWNVQNAPVELDRSLGMELNVLAGIGVRQLYKFYKAA